MGTYDLHINGEGTRWQFVRFIITGVANTLITLLVIVVCKSVLNVNPWVSNALGYVAGMINSFLLNRLWVFRQRHHALRQATAFLIGFGACYCLQLGATWLLTQWIHIEIPIGTVFTVSGYGIATIIGMGVYTIANFVYNKIIAFR